MKSETIVIERTYNAPVEKVWAALTDINQMRQWYFPQLKDFKPEVGFETNFIIEHNGHSFDHIWKVTEVVPNQKIAYEWRYAGYPGNSLLSLELSPDGDKTKLTLTHDKLETFQPDLYPELGKTNFVSGWTGFMDKHLKEFLETV